MSPPAQKALPFAGEDCDAGFGRSLDCTRSVEEGVDHRAVERIEFVRALQRQARARTVKAQIDEGAHCEALPRRAEVAD